MGLIVGRHEQRPGARWSRITGLLVAGFAGGITLPAIAQVVAVGEISLSGIVETVTGGGLTIRDPDGTRHQVLVQGKDRPGVALTDGTLLAAPVEVTVRAEFPVAGLQSGQVVRFRCRLNQKGEVEGTVSDLRVLDGGDPTLGASDTADAPLANAKPPAGRKQSVEREVTARVAPRQLGGGPLVVNIPRGKTWNGKPTLQVRLAEGAVARLTSDDPARIEPGARVVGLVAIQLQSGELVARSLEVENAPAAKLADKGDEAIWREFQELPNKPPAEAREVQSEHFAFMTDVSDREWAVIKRKLERMVEQLEIFLQRPMAGKVTGVVAIDLEKFPQRELDNADGVNKIKRGEGRCVVWAEGNRRQARLYSCADHGVIQHECVHGICHLTFGSTGPTWLAEGLAELGNYWRDGEQAIDLPPGVIAYLQNEQPKRKLLEIAVPGRTEAGTWQDYAWRWALCHLLANNPNYSDRFVPLAVALMEGREGVSFESWFGREARRISFEYDQFLETLGNGYRSDLTAWPWKAKFKRLAAGRAVTVKVKARGGWQPAEVLVEAGDRLEIEAAGTWKIAAAGQPLDADGEADGRGRLVATVFSDYTLTPEIPLGVKATIEPPATGQLFLRCADAWNELADNDGELTVTIRRAP